MSASHHLTGDSVLSEVIKGRDTSGRRAPTLRAQLLGKQLRELRESAKLTLKQAGDYLQREPGTMSRMESGIIPIRAADVMALLNLYGVEDQNLRDGLERLSRDIWRKGWWDGYDSDSMGVMIDYAWIEARAEEIGSYDAMVVPGLLQTREYAEATIRGADRDASDEAIKRWIEFRMNRQHILDQEKPPRVTTILDESVLERMIGGPDVMRAQLRKIVELSEHPAITVQVLPLRAASHASPEGPFTLFTMPDPYLKLAHVDMRGGAIYVESPKVENFARIYTHLREAALTPEESVALISSKAERIK